MKTKVLALVLAFQVALNLALFSQPVDASIFCNAIKLELPKSRPLSDNRTRRLVKFPFRTLMSQGATTKNKGVVGVSILDCAFPESHGGKEFWDLIYSKFYDSKTMRIQQTGYYTKESGLLYFMKINELGKKKGFRLLMFSNAGGNLLCGEYVQTDVDPDQWDKVSDRLLETSKLLSSKNTTVVASKLESHE